jgi:L-arabinose isomerase
LVADGGYGAFSINFQSFDRPDRPACAMPFLEISKAMARGLGYGGEGDVLTAALVAALAHGFGAASFTEIFCSDWHGDALFLSHMGEINPALAQDRPHVFAKKAFDGRSRDTAALTFAAAPGPAALVNLAPGPDDTFTLVTAPVEILAEDAARLDPAMRDTVRVWIRPRRPAAPFLEAYSRAGGTHHSALVPGACPAAIAAFGRMLGLACVNLD